MKIYDLKLDEVKPYEKNPRKNDAAVDKVAESIKQFGFKVPLVIDKNNVIVTGHTRYKAAVKLKLDTMPCIMADDLTDEQIKAYRLADNKVAEFSDWDMDLLTQELDDILEIEMTDFGFEDLSALDELDAVEDDFDIEPPEEPVAKLGDVYKLGKHILMCGDSTKIVDVQKLMGDIKADMLLTDPPYNVDYTGKTKDALKIDNDKMEDGKFRQFLTDAFACADAVMKPGAVFYIWHADSEGYNFRGGV